MYDAALHHFVTRARTSHQNTQRGLTVTAVSQVTQWPTESHSLSMGEIKCVSLSALYGNCLNT